MSPLSAITPTFAGYGVRPPAELAAGRMAPAAIPEIETSTPLAAPGETNPATPSGDSFANVLGRLVEDVDHCQSAAADAVSGLQSGQNVSLHQAVIAMEEANVSFQLMVEVRNKLLESYQELMRMQI